MRRNKEKQKEETKQEKGNWKQSKEKIQEKNQEKCQESFRKKNSKYKNCEKDDINLFIVKYLFNVVTLVSNFS